MAKLRGREIQELAKQIIEQCVGGIRYSTLLEKISAMHPETPRNTIHGAIWDLDKTFSGQIVKPSRGFFTMNREVPEVVEETSISTATTHREADFYDSFAQYLKNDLDEAREVVTLGGSGLRTKWGTPDVVGTFKPLPSDRLKFELEVISAEIKIIPDRTIEAFGQATAYRLFSHKVYLVLPTTVSGEDQARLEALALLFGIGLVLFKPYEQQPNYQVRVRAQRFAPDMFYLNEFADRLHRHNSPAFNKLFG